MIENIKPIETQEWNESPIAYLDPEKVKNKINNRKKEEKIGLDKAQYQVTTEAKQATTEAQKEKKSDEQPEKTPEKRDKKKEQDVVNYLEKRANKLSTDKAKEQPLFQTFNTLFGWENAENSFQKDLLQKHSDLLAQLLANKKFQNDFSKIIKEYLKNNSSTLIEKGRTQAEISQFSIESLKSLDLSNEKWVLLIKALFESFTEDYITKYLNIVLDQSKGKQSWDTGKLLRETITKNATKTLTKMTKWNLKQAKGMVKSYSKWVEKSETIPTNKTENKKVTFDSEITGMEIMNLFEKENPTLKDEIGNIDTSFQNQISQRFKDYMKMKVNTRCEKTLQKRVDKYLKNLQEEQEIHTSIKWEDFISGDELRKAITENRNNPTISFDKLNPYLKEFDEKSIQEFKDQIHKEFWKLIRHEQQWLKNKGYDKAEERAGNIEKEMNQEITANVIDKIRWTLNQNDSTKDFSLDLSNKEGIQVENGYIKLNGKYENSPCTLFYDISSGEVKVSSSFTHDATAINLGNKNPNTTLFKLPSFKEYKEIWLKTMNTVQNTKNIKGQEWKYLQKQFNEKITVNTNEIDNFALQTEKSKLFTSLSTMLGLPDMDISAENNPYQYQFLSDIANAIHGPDGPKKAQQINVFLTKIGEMKKLILNDTDEGRKIRANSKIMNKLFTLGKEQNDKKNLNTPWFNQNSLVLLLNHFIRKSTDQSTENWGTINEIRIADMNEWIESFNNHGDQAIQLAEAKILWETDEAKTDPQYTAYKNTALTKFLAS